MLRDFGKKLTNLRRGCSARRAKGGATKLGRHVRLALEPLEPRLVLDSHGLVINEFMAINDGTLADEDGDYSDWIEIYNPTDTTIDLDGWYLSDDDGNLRQWEFPAVSLEADGYLVVFASNKDRRVAGSELHTNFQLSGTGEYLALVEPDGTMVAMEFDPGYPAQSSDISYGLTQDVLTFAAQGDELCYLVPTASPDPAWNTLAFDGSDWVGGTPEPAVVFTEAGTGTPDYFEIQNLSDSAVDTLGWVAVANNARYYDINDVHSPLWNFPSSMEPFDLIYRGDITDDNIYWRTARDGWLLIVDDDANVVDFVVWGYGADDLATLDVSVNGFSGNPADVAWNGPPVSEVGATSEALQRIGNSDRDDATDWTFDAAPTGGEPNEDLAQSFPGGPTLGVGFSTDGGEFGGALETRIEEEMRNVNASLLTRILFDVDDPARYGQLLLRMKYDDGFVGYINGQEIASREAPDPLQWNSAAISDRPYADASVFEEIDVSAHVALLRAGTNVLAIHGLNDDVADGDFVILPELVGRNDQALDFMATPTPGALNAAAMVKSPEFSHTSNTYVDPITLTLSDEDSAATIRYTTDGSIPTEESTAYNGPIFIGTTTRIRARGFEANSDPSHTVSHGFIFLDPTVANFNSNLPLIVVDTFGLAPGTVLYTPVTSVFIDQGEGARVDLTDPIDFAGRGGMRIRGSSSLMFPKAQYAFEVWNENTEDTRAISAADGDDLAVSLLGMPEESDWIIHGPYSDKTLLRNYLSYTWSNDIEMYAVRTKMCEVFINTGGGKINYNSDYMGVYVFMEQIKRDDERVDIAELLPTHNSYPEITGGYIFKKDRGTDYFTTGDGQVFVYVEPKGPQYQGVSITAEQRAYLVGYINDFEDALGGANFADPDEGYAKYLDVDSFIDNHIMVEMTKNIDGFRLSAFYYKDRDKLDDQGNLIEPGKIKVGPIWDYNLSLGNANYLQGWLTEGWYNERFPIEYPGDPRWYPYWERISQDPNLGQRLIDRWTELRQDLFGTDRLLADIDTASMLLAESQVRNFQKWNILGTYVWPNPTGWNTRTTYQSEIDWMKSWLTGRLDWIDSQFLSPVTFDPGGGIIQAPTELTMDATTGLIHYTLNGTDPRLSGGGISPDALLYTDPITLTDTTLVTARAMYLDEWSGPTQSEFVVGVVAGPGNLAITELNYNPHEPTPAEVTAGFLDNDLFEYIEVQNLSSQAIDLEDAEFIDGIGFKFDAFGSTTPPPPIVVSEAGTGALDYIEIQNVSGAEVNTSGWVVAANNAVDYNINDLHAPLWSLPETIAADDFLYRRDTLGDNIYWRSSDEGWVLIVDDGGNVVDFVVWGYDSADLASMDVTVGGFSGNPAGTAWGGAAVPDALPSLTHLVRSGSADHNDATDWTFLSSGSPDVLNAGLFLPFGPAQDLFSPGEFAVVASDGDAFHFRYGSQIPLAGQFTGQLSNGGEQVILVDRFGQTILDFTYGDSNAPDWPDRADGNGSSLEIIDPQGDYLDPDNWRSSSEYLGTPGTVGMGPYSGVVINEALTHTDNPLVDAIELFNPTALGVDVGGWWLSDSNSELLKFAIRGDTTIPAGGYATFYEGHWVDDTLLFDQVSEFGGPGEQDFALNGTYGDDVWLLMNPGDGSPLRFVDHVEFDEAINGESFGRWTNSEGKDYFYPMTDRTFDGPNSGPRVGPDLIISEVMYNPADPDEPDAGVFPDDLEFIEIYNPTGQIVQLIDWRLRKGLDFDFAVDTSLDPRQALVVVSFDPIADLIKLADFRAYYGIGAEVQIVGGHPDRLGDTDDRVQLQDWGISPPLDPLYIPHPLEDEVDYLSTWYPTTDAAVDSLNRLGRSLWGDEKDNWTPALPTPGTAPLLDTTEVVGRHIFYNNSAWDDAIATDKDALAPGEQADFANYTSYALGINGIMVDVFGATNPSGITANDFIFKVGNDGAPALWDPAPAPSGVELRDIGGDTTRIVLTWDDGDVVNQWLEVTVKANGNIGLAAADVFYFGNAVGETGNSAGDAEVDALDVLATRNNPHTFWNPAGIENAHDHNRDRRVDAVDTLIVRDHQSWAMTELSLIDLSGSKASESVGLDLAQRSPTFAEPEAGPEGGTSSQPTSLSLNEAAAVSAHDVALEQTVTPSSDPRETPLWLYELDRVTAKDRSAKKDGAVEEAIDRLLATYYN